MIKIKVEVVRSSLVIAASSLAALLLAAGEDVPGIAITVVLILVSLYSSWHGLLSLFPMLFAINPVPPAIGLAETAFASLAAASFFSSLIEEVRDAGWAGLTLRYRWPVIIALVWAASNLLVARQNGVPFADWARGAAPFCFLIFALPLARALSGRPEQMAWLGAAIAAYLLMLMSHIMGYYLAHALYEPYWIVKQGGAVQRIAATALAQHPDATGPYFYRITAFLPRATTVLMSAGMVLVFVVLVRAQDRGGVRTVAGMLAALCLLTMLATYTRSMLLIAAMSTLVFIAASAWWGRRRFLRALTMFMVLVAWGGAVIWAFDMGDMWSDRIRTSLEVGHDANVTSRLQEIRMAWGRFQLSPILGDGLGIKNPVVYVGESGPIEKQVAYIHNWFFYVLMVGGIVGCGFYAFLLFAPMISGLREAGDEPLIRHVARFGVLAFAGYGLVFAVFRQIDFNLLLAAAWAITLATQTERNRVKV